MTRRLDLMSKALKKDVEKIDAACIKTVPIRWVGMASDIRIMGSFDHWTKGVAMSPEHIEGGSNVFVADMNLVAGTYEITRRRRNMANRAGVAHHRGRS